MIASTFLKAYDKAAHDLRNTFEELEEFVINDHALEVLHQTFKELCDQTQKQLVNYNKIVEKLNATLNKSEDLKKLNVWEEEPRLLSLSEIMEENYHQMLINNSRIAAIKEIIYA